MAKRKKSNKKPGKGGRIALLLFTALLLTLGAAIGIGALNADIVRIRRAEIILPDLPRGFDGTTILYASDIDLCGLNTPERSGRLFDRLQSLKPDILLLGGDYTSSSLLEVMNGAGSEASGSPEKREARRRFFHYISSFDAPMGKFAIASPEDEDWDDLGVTMKESGVMPLFNDRAAIRSGSDTLWIAGVCRESASLNSAGSTFNRQEAVLVAAYSPEVLPVLLTSEACDGGQWADLLLCGHTHGGQIRLFGRSVLPLSARELRYLSGWNTDSGFPILINQGLGCEGVNLRLGTQPEVWLLTLRKA